MAKTSPEMTCPICLVSSNEPKNTNESIAEDGVKFLTTPCKHVFCQPCIERVLLKPSSSSRSNGSISSIPTRAACPMCREEVNLFDMRCSDSSSSVYAVDINANTWPVANFQYKQRCLIPMQNPESLLQRIIDQKGVIEGHGIKFRFDGAVPSVEFAKPLKVAFYCDWTEVAGDDDSDNLLTLDSIAFDRHHFHRESMTFHGNVSFTNPVCSGMDSYFYKQLSCLLHFSENGHYIRKGNLRWKLAQTSTAFPLDGCWEVQYNNGHTMVIHIQKHKFDSLDVGYNITIDQHSFCPRFLWPGSVIEQTTDHQILPGTSGPSEGQTLEWKTIHPGHERIVWKRLSSAWKSIDVQAGNFVYQRINQQSESEQSLGPSYHAETIWGNVFCQAYCVGLASYHFLEPDEDGNYQAHISYENPRTEVWPSLDNNNTVPPRVPFRNISWEPETRTFEGDICWEEDFGTTWMNESKWCYKIIFDPTFMFVVSGTCTRSTGEPHQFGDDLIYINAALETPLREINQTSETTGQYLDVIRQWRDGNASTGTLDMMGEVAMAVRDGESLFDFNL